MRFNKVILAFAITMLCIVFIGCGFNGSTPYEREIFSLDTFINLKIYGENGEENANLAQKKITQFENMFSVTNPNSDVSKINSESVGTNISTDTVKLIQFSLDMSNLTNGAFDISVYPVVKLWGFTTEKNNIPKQSDIDNALNLVDYRKISVDESKGRVTLEKNTEIDLGAVAKGYISQQIADMLKQNGVESAVLSFGGNIQTVGLKNGRLWQIGIKYPDSSESFAMLSVGETAIVTSAADQRFFEENGKKYHHIIDPSTGYPAENGTKSVTVVCNDGAKADALSTAIFVMGAEEAIQFYKSSEGFDFVILTEDDTLYVTSGLSESFSVADNYSHLKIKLVEK